MSKPKFPRWFEPYIQPGPYKAIRFDSETSGTWIEMDGSTSPVSNPRALLRIAIAFQRELTEDEAKAILDKEKGKA